VEEDYSELKPHSRHGCVTFWLILIIIFNSVSALFYFIQEESINYDMNGEETIINRTQTLYFSALTFTNLFFAVNLFKLKKWAFYGFIITTLGFLALNLDSRLGLGNFLTKSIGVAFLYALLQLRNMKGVSTWENLK
jgi:hypothetical protein